MEMIKNILPYMGMISAFLIYFSIYKMKKDKNSMSLYDSVTNFDEVDRTVYQPYLTLDNPNVYNNVTEEEKNSFMYKNLYKYIRKYSVGNQDKLVSIVPVKYLDLLNDALEQSGRKYGMRALEFLTTAILVGGVTFAALLLFGSPLYLALILAAVMVYIFPINDVLIEPRKHRRKQILIDLPNVLDFFYILMSAGNSFDESLREIAYTNSHPLAMEFRRVIDEIENKKIPEARAYGNSVKRVHLEQYTGFMQAILASKELGSNIIKSIQDKSSDLKEEIRTEKEKKIEKLETKVVLPIMIFFLPTAFIGLFGPTMFDMLSGF